MFERGPSASLGLPEIVGVHDERLGEIPRGAGELAEHEDTLLVVTRGHELLGHEVHPVVEAAHVTEVGGAVVAEDGGGLVVRAEQDDRPVAPADPLRVDLGGERFDASLSSR
jgi:hypothetical protein